MFFTGSSVIIFGLTLRNSSTIPPGIRRAPKSVSESPIARILMGEAILVPSIRTVFPTQRTEDVLTILRLLIETDSAPAAYNSLTTRRMSWS